MDRTSPLLTLFRSSLRAKFIGLIAMVQVSLMLLVTVVIEQRQRETILQESRKRASSLASNLAALSEGYLLSYNFIKLEQAVERITAEEDVAYAVVQLHDGKVAAYSGRRVQPGTVLKDPVSQQALKAQEPLVQEVNTPELQGRGYDVAIPFFVPGSDRKWGTIRIGFSLAHAMQEIQKTTQNLVLLGIIAVLLGMAEAVFLAQRISKPIQRLVEGVDEVATGNYDHAITAASQDEIGYLAHRFEEMRKALRDYVANLAEETRHLQEANELIKATQEQLIQSEKLAAVGKLAARVAHEVNNPLAVIKTSLSIVSRRLAGEDVTKENLDIVEEEIERIARTVRQLFDFSRPASDISLLQVNEVIQNLMKFMEATLAARRIESRLELADDLPRVRMSLDQLKQVLLNLIKNAQEAMPQGGSLRITTARQPDGLVIRVADTGMGIPQERLPLLFTSFFTTKKPEEGRGLGLSVSSNIVRSYGGDIGVESEPGKGSVFRIFLPEYPLHLTELRFPAREDVEAKEE
jgi:signal transduction histidine kinase